MAADYTPELKKHYEMALNVLDIKLPPHERAALVELLVAGYIAGYDAGRALGYHHGLIDGRQPGNMSTRG